MRKAVAREGQRRSCIVLESHNEMTRMALRQVTVSRLTFAEKVGHRG